MDLAFVIPARNESATIAKTIESIRNAVGEELQAEVIVVDNDSSDRTAQVAAAAGATVYNYPHQGSIAGVRNYGAVRARGEVLVFVDADVTLSHEWLDEFLRVQPQLVRGKFVMSGSYCSIPTDASWFERVWIRPRRHSAASHIGSGHMIVRADDFESVGGFNARLSTGEDYDISQRFLASGGSLIRMQESSACHHGNPRTLAAFFKREMWHGSGDFQSLAILRRSTVAKTALLMAGLHIMLAVSIILPVYSWFPRSLIGAAISVLCLICALRNYRGAGPVIILINTALYYVYLWARCFSVFIMLDRSLRSLPVREVASDIK